MTRRNLEILLLAAAVPVVALLFVMVNVSDGAALTWESMAVPAGLFAAFLVAHLVCRFAAPNADPAILPIVFALSGIGIAFVTRLRPDLAGGQVIYLGVGVVAMCTVLLLVRNLDKLAQYKYTFMLAGIVLLVLPMLPGIGMEIYGSRIWISVGGFSFQPGEIAKICIVIFLAGYLAQNREMISVFTVRVGRLRLPDLPTLLPMLIMWAISFLIVVFEKDLGSALVCFVLFLVMLYVASGKKFYLVIGFGLAALGCIILYHFFGHVQQRVNIWLDPFADMQDSGYQLVQAIFSMADGGLLGVGVNNGMSAYIPVVESDFIFAAIAEELGLLGGAGVLLLYLSLAIRGFATAARAKSDVSALVAVGVTVTIVLQAFIIVGGVTRLIPLTGLTLPFVSQGGSSLLASFIGIGLLLRCGDEGTGIATEMADGTQAIPIIRDDGTLGSGGAHARIASSQTGVLGRVALGQRLTATLIAFAVLFALLVINLTYIMVIKAPDYQTMPGNNHTMYKEAQTERGSISTYDGVVLAESVLGDDGTYVRVYPEGQLAAHVVGYYSQTYGNTGIEAAMNDTLVGQANFASWSDAINYLAGINTPGNDVTLTIDSNIQQTAEDVLSGYAGAVVVLNPQSGAILAMASSPGYDAGEFAEVLAAAADGSDSGGVLVNRATEALYAPGSTFKLVTLTSLLENDVADVDTYIDAPGSIEIGNAEVTNYGHENYGTVSLKVATELSSNTAYGQLGVELGAKRLVATAETFGFDKTIDAFELPLYASVMSDPNLMTEWELAWAACGQPVGEHQGAIGPQATVLQMALVASAIANDGKLMTPYLVEGVYGPAGVRSYSATPTVMSTVMRATTANVITDFMVGVVEEGTGMAARIDGVTVAGKTGTAETNNEYNDSWFVGFAPADNPTVVVAVLIEEGVYGTDESGLASARAQTVMEEALSVQGNL